MEKILTALVNGIGRVLRENDTAAIRELRKVFKNSSFSIPTNIVNLGFNFIIAILLARWLGIVALGQYALATAVAGIVFGIVNLGIQGILTREVAKDTSKAEEYLGNSLAIRLFVSLPVGVGVSCLLAWGLDFQFETAILIIVASIFTGLAGVVSVLYCVFQAVGKFEYPFIYTLFYKAASFVGCVLLLVNGQGLIYILILFAALQVVTGILVAAKISEAICSVRLIVNLRFWRSFVRTSFPLALSGTTEFINLKGDAVILGALKGDWDTGIYNGASNLYLGVTAPALAFFAAFFPIFSQTYKVSKKQAVRLFRNVFLIALFVSLALALFIGLFSNPIVMLIYGEDFVSSALPLMILAWGLPFIILNRLCNYALISMGFQKWMFYVISSGAIFNVAVNILLIPGYSFVGASITTVATEALIFVAVFWKCYSCLRN